jgi:hypothetical protein
MPKTSMPLAVPPNSKSGFRLLLPRGAKVDPGSLNPLLGALHALSVPAVLELFSEGQGGSLRIQAPEALLRQHVAAAYPGSRLEVRPLDRPSRPLLRAQFLARQHGPVPFCVDLGVPSLRPLTAIGVVPALLSVLDAVRPGEYAVLQLVLQGPTSPDGRWITRFLEATEIRPHPRDPSFLDRLFGGSPDLVGQAELARTAAAVRAKALLPLFRAEVWLVAGASSRERTIEVVKGMVAAISALSARGLNELVPVLAEAPGHNHRGPSALHPLVFSLPEVLALWHPPTDPSGPGRGCFIQGIDLPSPPLLGEGVQLGWASRDGDAQPVRIPHEDLRRHAVFLGASGGGKSTSLLTLMLSLADQGHGFGVIDVKGDLADDFLGRVPDHRRRDVHVIDPVDPSSGAGVDLFGIARRLDPDLSADFVVSAFQAQFSESWGVAFPRPMKAAVRALLEVPGTSLADLPRMLRDPEFRREILAEASDDATREYFAHVGPALTRIGSAIDSSFGRRLFASPSGPDLRAVMDAEEIVVCRYHGGLLGKQNADLFAGLTAAACQLAAMTRVTLPEQERKTWTLLCDEAHDYATSSFADTLSLGRGYGFSLVLATQFLNQVTAKVRSSTLANASTLLCFRLGEEDISLVGRRFEPHVNRHELTELSNYTGIVRTTVHGERQPPFLLYTRPSMNEWSEETAEEVRSASRRRFPPRALEVRVRRLEPEIEDGTRPLVRWDDIEESEV